MKKGKLIVIEGIDGSGKATQTKKLINYLRRDGKKVATFAFPRHGKQIFGLMVDDYLNNKFGDAAKLDPHISSLFFACDRFEAKDKINKWLKEGNIVILDRYATSNMAHQASKIRSRKKRDQFLKWLARMEFNTFQIPKPDMVIYLDVDPVIVRRLMKYRSKIGKEYIKGSRDGHERNKNHLTEAANAYKYLAKKYNYWTSIKCTHNNKLLTIDQIHDNIIKTIQ
jgi:dTMP kinase